MKILMFSWEYPPVSHGGLARHVQDLSEALVAQGHNIYVITQGASDLPLEDMINGVHVFRSESISVSGNNFAEDILHLNFQMLERAIEVMKIIKEVDLIHGHDWLVFWASKVLKHSLTKPLVYTIHATEFGRNQGIYNNLQRYINDIEWYCNYEAWKVIVCSHYMAQELKNLFQVPEDKIRIIPNGVNEENYLSDYSPEFRNSYASSDEKIIYYVGRIVREKGIQVLIQALPQILNQYPAAKLVISGKGGFLSNLKQQAEYMGIADRIYFTGFINDEIRNKLYRACDIAVFPSLYEPFGIVALEAMVTHTPVIVSNVGGLTEFVQDGENGLIVNANDPKSLADKIVYLLTNPKKGKEMADKGYRMAKEEYSWQEIAGKTAGLYKKVLSEYQLSDWKRNGGIIEEENKEQIIYRYG